MPLALPGETPRVRRWWAGFTAALLLLLPADLLTTLVTVAAYGPAAEANPVMRWLLRQGLVTVTLVHLVVVGVVVYAFHVAVGSVGDAPERYRDRLAQGVDLWVTLALAAGVALVANNLVVLL